MNEVRATFSGEKEIKEEVDTTSNLQADWMDWNIDWIEQTGPLPWARLYILAQHLPSQGHVCKCCVLPGAKDMMQAVVAQAVQKSLHHVLVTAGGAEVRGDLQRRQGSRRRLSCSMPRPKRQWARATRSSRATATATSVLAGHTIHSDTT